MSFRIIHVSSSTSVAKCRRFAHNGLVSSRLFFRVSTDLGWIDMLQEILLCLLTLALFILKAGVSSMQTRAPFSVVSSPQRASMSSFHLFRPPTRAPASSFAHALHGMLFCRLIPVETTPFSSDESLPILQFESFLARCVRFVAVLLFSNH